VLPPKRRHSNPPLTQFEARRLERMALRRLLAEQLGAEPHPVLRAGIGRVRRGMLADRPS
jgi:hypothetical protein